MKRCPFCAEEIQDAAIKCKHCGEFLDSSHRPPPLPTKEASVPWYYRTAFIVFMLASLGPLALPLIWFRPHLRWEWKLVISAATLVLTWYLVKVSVKSVHEIEQYYRLLGG